MIFPKTRQAADRTAKPSPTFRRSPLGWAALALAGVASMPAFAVELETGNPDAVLRWDTTVRYSYGVRMQGRNPALLANPNMDDGDRNFGKGDAVANRLDLLTELDLVVSQKYGLRMSAAGWTDAAYRKLASDAASPATYNGTGGPGYLSAYTSRFAKGPSGEILDAFVFSNFSVGETPVKVRLGRHTAFWGEALLAAGAVNSVSYGQYSLDLWKANATPGAEAKELYRPRNGLTVQAQPTDQLTIVGQTFFEWEPARLPESGTYLSGSDVLLAGAQRLFLGPGVAATQGSPVNPRSAGDWGLAARWSPEWLDGTLGVYLRRTSDILPQLWAANAGAGLQYRASYGRNIDVFGLSLNKVFGGTSVGAEASVRRNMPLVSDVAAPAGAQAAAINAGLLGLAAQGQLPGARGRTAHLLVNFISVLPQTALYSSASLGAEFTWNRVLSVTSDPFNRYKGSAVYRANPLAIDAISRDASTLALSFTPSWLSAFPSADISLPVTYNAGLSGQSGVTSGGNRRSGSRSIGVVVDYLAKYNFALRYIEAFGPYSTNPLNGMALVTPGTANISDRGMLVFTFKTTF